MALRTSRSSCIVYAPSLVSTSGACHGKFKLRHDETYEREVSALSKLPKVYPCKRRMIITYDEEATLTDEDGVIEVVPCWKWMLQQA